MTAVDIRYQILGKLVTVLILRGVCVLLRQPIFCTLSETLRISPNRTHIEPLRYLRHLTYLLTVVDKRINTFVRHKNVHPETQSTHSVALSVEEKVAQLRRRLKFHRRIKVSPER